MYGLLKMYDVDVVILTDAICLCARFGKRGDAGWTSQSGDGECDEFQLEQHVVRVAAGVRPAPGNQATGNQGNRTRRFVQEL